MLASTACARSEPAASEPVEASPPASDPEAERAQAISELRARLEAELAENPNDGALLYTLARADANSGEGERALERLERLAALESWDYPLELADFGPLAETARLRAVAATLAARAPKIEHGPVALELDRVDILPEGIAWDARRSELLVGSMHQRMVLAADAEGRTRELVAPKTEGLLGVLGVDVDEARDQLWVVGAAAPFMADYDKADAGRSGLWAFELESGAPVAKVMAPSPSQLNDLVVLGDGRVLATESLGGSVLELAPGGERLEPILPAGTLAGANGIVAAEGEDAIYVADFRGIHRVTLEDGERILLEAPAPVASLGGIDGLERQGNTLVGVQNLWCPGRIWALELDATGEAITAARILDDSHPKLKGPTTGTFVGEGEFWYLANAALQFEGRELVEAPPGARHLILELAL